MSFCYNKLWKKLIDKGMSKTQLRDAVKINPNTLAKLSKNQNVSLEVLGRLCKELQCDIGDIVEYIPHLEGDK